MKFTGNLVILIDLKWKDINPTVMVLMGNSIKPK